MAHNGTENVRVNTGNKALFPEALVLVKCKYVNYFSPWVVIHKATKDTQLVQPLYSADGKTGATVRKRLCLGARGRVNTQTPSDAGTLLGPVWPGCLPEAQFLALLLTLDMISLADSYLLFPGWSRKNPGLPMGAGAGQWGCCGRTL